MANREGIKIGSLWFHRLEQWDLNCWPILCVHRTTPNRICRVFCLWRDGWRLRMVANWERLGKAGKASNHDH